MAIDATRTPESRAIHGGLQPDPGTGAILTPIHQSTTFVQEAIGVHKGYTYTRTGNPTVAALEHHLGALENALPAISFATGMAAISGLCLALLQARDHVIVSDVVYGGTVRLLRQILNRFGLEADFVDTASPDAVAAAIRPNTRLVLIETPANPTLKLADIAALAQICRTHGLKLAVDNTFLTPILQAPLDLGADVAIYSTTKFLEGHNSTVGGALTTRDPELAETLRFVQGTLGCAQSPFGAWLTQRGIKTLPLRMRQHCENARIVARDLEQHPWVQRVLHPGLESFPQRELALRQQAAGGGLLSFVLQSRAVSDLEWVRHLELVSLAENLGAVETLLTHPASMTHASVPKAERETRGIHESLFRLSVGLEHPQEILADLDQAWKASRRVKL